jgi:hypothetical protein
MSITIIAIATFLLGYFLHLFLMIDKAVRDTGNPASSRWILIKQNAGVLAVRFFFSILIYAVVRTHPQLLATLAGYIGINPSSSWLGQLTLITNIPLSGVFGYEVDSLLAYIPFLKNEVPQFPAPDAKTKP